MRETINKLVNSLIIMENNVTATTVRLPEVIRAKIGNSRSSVRYTEGAIYLFISFPQNESLVRVRWPFTLGGDRRGER